MAKSSVRKKPMLPVCINLSGRLAVLVGGGHYALRKAQNLVGEGCKLRVISTSLLPAFYDLDLDLEWIQSAYAPEHLKGAFIVWACTDHIPVNGQVLSDCKELNILCTAAHHRADSDFINPVQWKGPQFSAAIWSGGKDPRYTQHLRDLWSRFWGNGQVEPGVYLVGFGPGDLELLTLKALRLIQAADVILYDDLIDTDVLKLCRGECIYVGKRAGQHSMVQSEINELIYLKSQSSPIVLRLKGGDPFVFGRGGEELVYLRERQVQVKVVPGITTALAAAAAAQVPLTHRGLARSLTLQTAHHLDDSPPIYPQSGTLALYMGARRLGVLQEQLIAQGWDAHTPVVLVHAVGMPGEISVRCTLSSMAQQDLGSPLCVLIGDAMSI